MSSPFGEEFKLEDIPEHLRDRYYVEPTGEEGMISCHSKHEVACNDCKQWLHMNTTNPMWWIEIHERDHHDPKFGLTEEEYQRYERHRQ